MPQKHPLWHVSIRVPWHDTSWDGRTFDFPHLNGSCLKLKRIAEDKNKAPERGNTLRTAIDKRIRGARLRVEADCSRLRELLPGCNVIFP